MNLGISPLSSLKQNSGANFEKSNRVSFQAALMKEGHYIIPGTFFTSDLRRLAENFGSFFSIRQIKNLAELRQGKVIFDSADVSKVASQKTLEKKYQTAVSIINNAK